MVRHYCRFVSAFAIASLSCQFSALYLKFFPADLFRYGKTASSSIDFGRPPPVALCIASLLMSVGDGAHRNGYLLEKPYFNIVPYLPTDARRRTMTGIGAFARNRNIYSFFWHKIVQNHFELSPVSFKGNLKPIICNDVCFNINSVCWQYYVYHTDQYETVSWLLHRCAELYVGLLNSCLARHHPAISSPLHVQWLVITKQYFQPVGAWAWYSVLHFRVSPSMRIRSCIVCSYSIFPCFSISIWDAFPWFPAEPVYLRCGLPV